MLEKSAFLTKIKKKKINVDFFSKSYNNNYIAQQQVYVAVAPETG